MITNKRNKDCITFHLSYLIPEGSRVLPLSMRYASLAFRTLSLLDLMSSSSGAPRARSARVGGAPLLSKSTHPRKFGNHVTVHRPSVRTTGQPMFTLTF